MLDNLFVIKDEENIELDKSLTTLSFPENWVIDLINLKVFALLMCPGEPKDKADILFDLIYGPPKKGDKKSDEDTITWLNPRLVQVVRKLIFFSELFPK